MLGSCLAAAFYKFIKALEYETANPDQDAAAQYYDEDGKSRPNTARSVKHHSLTHQISPGAYSERTKVGFARPSDDFGVTADPAMMSEQSFVPQTPSPMTPARYSQDRVQPATYLSTDGQTLTADGCVRKLGRGSSYAV
jgi:aquaporin related protein